SGRKGCAYHNPSEKSITKRSQLARPWSPERVSRTGKSGTGGGAGRTCPVGKLPTPATVGPDCQTCQPDLPIRGEAGQERCGESETQRPVSGVASRSDSETRGEINSPVSRAGGSRPDTGDSKSGPASPGSGQRTIEPWWQSRRSETGSKHCPAESQRLTETETGRQGNMPLPGGNAEPQRSEMYELTAADFRDGLAGHRTVLPN